MKITINQLYCWTFVLLMGVIGWTACCREEAPDPALEEERAFEAFFRELGDSVTVRPARVRAEALRRMGRTKDSIVYNRYKVVMLKTFLASDKPDSAFLLVNQLERFVMGTPFSPRLADLRADVLNMKGNLCARYSSTDSAICAFSEAYAWHLRGIRQRPEPDILMNLADAYNHVGRLDQGAATYRRALFLMDSLQLSDERKTPVYYGLAHTYMALRDFENCDYYYDLAARYYDGMLPFEKTFYLNNRGNSYYFRGDYARAIAYFKRLEALNARYPDSEFNCNLCWLNLSDCYLQQGRADSASCYLDRCEPFFRRQGMPTANYYIDTQRMQLALLQGNYPQALRYYHHSQAGPDIDPEMVRIRNKNLQRYFEETGDYRRAYYFMRQNVHLDDSLRNERVRLRAAEMALRYQQDSTLLAKNVLIEQQRIEVLQLQRTQLLWLSVVITLGFLLLLLYLYNRRKRQNLLEHSRRTVSALRWENMRNRLSPHFIFNVLNQHLNGCDANEQKELVGLVKLMRRNLELAERLSVSLREELDFVETYIDLERKSLGVTFRSEVRVDEAVDVDTLHIPTMMIQIPVENAVKHALRAKEGERRLWIAIDAVAGGVEIRVTDNGGGFKALSSGRGTGTGLKVVMQTVQLLNRFNRQPIEVEVKDVQTATGEKGCCVRFVVPVHYKYKV